jgi:hypothetical protein
MQEISTVIFFVTHTVSERNRVGCKWFALQTKGALQQQQQQSPVAR